MENKNTNDTDNFGSSMNLEDIVRLLLSHRHRGTDTPKISYNDLKDKSGSGSGLTLVESGTFTSDKTISGLDGDNDGMYILVIRTNHSSAYNITLQFNSDTGSNYTNLKHYVSNQNGTVSHSYENNTGETAVKPTHITQHNFILTMTINPKSGYPRTIYSSCSGYQTGGSYQDIVQTSSIWTNTADNLTSIKIITGTITSGEYALYKTN